MLLQQTKEDKLPTSMQTGSASSAKPKSSSAVSYSVADVLKVVTASLEDSKVEDMVSIDIKGKSALGDHMIVASGRSHRHVGAIADHLMRELKNNGFGSPKVEGLQSCDWVLVDTGDIIIHIFRPEVRDFYGIEKMWQMPDQNESH